MGETSLTADVLEHLDQLGSADIVVGIPSFRNAATIPHVVQAASAERSDRPRRKRTSTRTAAHPTQPVTWC